LLFCSNKCCTNAPHRYLIHCLSCLPYHTSSFPNSVVDINTRLYFAPPYISRIIAAKHYTHASRTDREANNDWLRGIGFFYWLRKSVWPILALQHHTISPSLLLSPHTRSGLLILSFCLQQSTSLSPSFIPVVFTLHTYLYNSSKFNLSRT